MTLEEFNNLSKDEVKTLLLQCCSSQAWAEELLNKRPFSSIESLKKTSDSIWWELSKSDWLEAFDGHPKIGDVNSLKEKYRSTKAWAGNEQSGVDEASDKVISELAEYNDLYDKRYGYIFIVCATGKSALEMLNILKSRIDNDPSEELKIAAGEQNKITHIRLEKLL